MIPAELKVHTATVEPFEGSGAYGEIYGAPASVSCYYEGRRQLVRNGDGDEVVSEGVLFAELDANIPTGSRVTVLGRETYAITVSVFDDGGLTGLAHQEVALA